MTNLNVIWISSYPRSGNTWLQTVIRRAGADYGFPPEDMDIYKLIRERGAPEICDAVRDEFAGRPCTVLKTHSVYRPQQQLHELDGTTLNNVGFIHIYRNPLDVLLSYLNFTRIQYQNQKNKIFYKRRRYQNALFRDLLGFRKPYGIEAWKKVKLEDIPQRNLDHALDFFSDNDLVIKTMKSYAGGWLENVESWMQAHDDMKGISIRYEDCLADPETFLCATEFFKFGRDDVMAALQSFNSKVRELSDSGNIFYNKLSAYYFRDYFSEAAVDRFLQKHEDTLRKYGYAGLLETDGA